VFYSKISFKIFFILPSILPPPWTLAAAWLPPPPRHTPPRICKPELYSLIKLRKPRLKTFKIDALLEEHGYSVVLLPPCHSYRNPIEVIQASVKEYVAGKDVSFRLVDAVGLAEKKFSVITKEGWSSMCSSEGQCEKN
jgi:hypothetical protein